MGKSPGPAVGTPRLGHSVQTTEEDVHRRVGTAVAVGVFTLGLGALTALSKSKEHFVGLTWADGDRKGGLAMHCDKND